MSGVLFFCWESEFYLRFHNEVTCMYCTAHETRAKSNNNKFHSCTACRIEAAQCPDVVVAQIDPKKLKRKQSVNISVSFTTKWDSSNHTQTND